MRNPLGSGRQARDANARTDGALDQREVCLPCAGRFHDHVTHWEQAEYLQFY
jgi:hypothetical protein